MRKSSECSPQINVVILGWMSSRLHSEGAADPRLPWIRLANPDVGEEELEAIKKVLFSGILTNGPQTAAFEDVFARRHKVSQAVAFANGTVALAAIYTALGIGPGDEVIVPSMTFISTATSVLHVGARPVFAEVTEDTFNLDPADVETRLTPRTRAIVAVHYGGQPADLEELGSIARAAGIDLIEDAAQAHGASYKGRPVGGFGGAAMFSFTPTKNITTGEGGIVTTNDDDLAGRLRLLRNHGQTRLYHHDVLGYNWRMTEMQAAMGIVQLSKLDGILARKWVNARYLRSQLPSSEELQLPVACEDRTHAYMLFTVKVREGHRDRIMDTLLNAGIEARLYFPPAHLQPIFMNEGVSLPRTERLANRMMSIPFHSRLSQSEIDVVVEALQSAVA